MSSDPSWLDRTQILAALKSALEPLDYVYAMWEGGAAAFNRVDEWSDIDVQFDVDDARVADTFVVIERMLETLSPIDLKYKTPQLPWARHLAMVLSIEECQPILAHRYGGHSAQRARKVLTREIHGQAVFYFDKANVSQVAPLESEWI